jgi:Molybdopterin converting factor, small subunit
MKITVNYFGLIKDKTHLSQEYFELNSKVSLTTFLEKTLFVKYPSLKTIDFRIAVNNVMCENNRVITAKDTLSLMPFFSGG